MRAGAGAIDRVFAQSATKTLAYRVMGALGEEKPAGICGSGMLDAVAAMREIGLLDESGRVDGRMPEQGVVLAPAEASAGGRPVVITRRDVRQIQLAKAALETGIALLMRAAKADHVDRLVLTGAFGARFNWKSAAAIGMLPRAVVGGRVETPPNSAGEGAVMALLDKRRRKEALSLAARIQSVELAGDPEFGALFVKATKLKAGDSLPDGA